MAATFRCGHPKTSENSIPSGAGNSTCKLCHRIRRICYAVLRDQVRINAGLPPQAHRGHTSRYAKP
jgi:hypothetical protein